MSHTDDFVFQYLLMLNFLHWPFRHLPRDKSLEQEFIKLGQKQYSTECNPEFQKLQEKSIRYQYWSSTVWEQLKLDTLKNELMKFSIAPKEILEKFGDIVPADFTPRFHCSPSNVVRVNAFEWQYFFQDKNGFYYYGILYRKQKKSKLLIPFCIGQNHHYSFWPDNLQCIFFNSGFIESADVLILTDDIACAASNQTLFWRSGNSDLAWLSWYGDMSRYPWEQLKEKKVYFFMEQHSGLNYEQMFETAIRVQEQLRAVGGPELSLIFMNPDEILGLSPYRTNIPMIINLEEWKNWTANFRIQGSDPFDYFKHKVAPRPRHSTPFGIAPSLVYGNRILVTGSCSNKELFLVALLAPFCGCTFIKVPLTGKVLFVRQDQSSLTEWIETLQINHGLNVSDLNQWQLSNNISGPYPLLLDMPLNISTLDPKSTSDCQHLLTLIEQAVWRQNTEGSKVLVLDSLSQFLVKVLNSTLLFLENLYNNGWTVFFVESRRTPYLKAFHCDQVIVVEPSPVCTGIEVVCSTATLIHGKIKKFYSINLVDRNQPILKESSYNRKSAGLLRPRWQLEKELIRLFRAGAKGKEIAERLQISESMVKKLKREYGLSKPRSRPDLNPSGNNYYGPNFMHPKPK